MRCIKVFITALMLLLTGCAPQIKGKDVFEFRKASAVPKVTDINEQAVCHEQDEEHIKAMWISYIDLAPMLDDSSEEEFQKQFDEACKDIEELGCNTIFVHVRPFGDALYSSQLFPPSDMAGDFDAMDIMCSAAHEHGLKIHAWINPLRLQTEDSLCQKEGFLTAEWYSAGTGQICKVYGDKHLWLDPAYAEVRELIAAGAAEIVRNYPVDGIHYDDYFYPTTDETFDAQCYEEMSSGESLDNWRRGNIDMMCGEINRAVKAENSAVCVSISPQGNMENNFNTMYADVEKWCSQDGYCDIIIPQIYYGYEDSVKPFAETLNEWRSLCLSGGRKIVVGLAPYKIGADEEFTENAGIIARQIADCADCSGVALYSYSSFFGDNIDIVRMDREKQKVAAALEKIDDEC